MGRRNLDRIGFDEWAQFAPAVGRMRAQGWRVKAECSTCGLQIAVNLDLVIQVRGPNLKLWGNRQRCRDLRCRGGVMDFWALPPGGIFWGRMEAQASGGPLTKPQDG